jgi:ABC-type sugar transport system ATPase subunit
VTVIYVTHDPEEAKLMVDRIVRREEGKMHSRKAVISLILQKLKNTTR